MSGKKNFVSALLQVCLYCTSIKNCQPFNNILQTELIHVLHMSLLSNHHISNFTGSVQEETQSSISVFLHLTSIWPHEGRPQMRSPAAGRAQRGEHRLGVVEPLPHTAGTAREGNPSLPTGHIPAWDSGFLKGQNQNATKRHQRSTHCSEITSLN